MKYPVKPSETSKILKDEIEKQYEKYVCRSCKLPDGKHKLNCPNNPIRKGVFILMGLLICFCAYSQRFLVDTKQIRLCNDNGDCGKWSQFTITRQVVTVSDSTIEIRGAEKKTWKIIESITDDGLFLFFIQDENGNNAICDFLMLNRGTWLFMSHGDYDVLYLLRPPKRKHLRI